MAEKEKKGFVNPLNADRKKSYDELDELCAKLYIALNNADMTNTMKRLDYLFKVCENAKVISDPEFLNECISEIKELIIIPKDNQ